MAYPDSDFPLAFSEMTYWYDVMHDKNGCTINVTAYFNCKLKELHIPGNVYKEYQSSILYTHYNISENLNLILQIHLEIYICA